MGDDIMKMQKLMALFLAVAMLFSMAVGAFARVKDNDDYDNQDVFDIKEPTGTLSPGVDYYFDCTWGKDDITDDFFEFYKVGVSVGSVDDRDTQREDGYDGTKTSTARKIVEAAEFVKLDNSDKYYFHFRAKGSYNYKKDDDAEVRITVTAYDKSRSKDREDYKSWVELDLDIGYRNMTKNTDSSVWKNVSGSSYDVDNDYPMISFDDDLDYCKLTFEDGSYYNAHLKTVRDFNLGISTDINGTAKAAYPNAKLKCLTFYAKPSFYEESVLKVKAPDCEYLYQIVDENSLVLVGQGNNNGYLACTTKRLGSYLASDVALDTSLFSANVGKYENYAQTASQVNNNTTASSAAQDSGSQSFQSGTDVITNPNTGAAA